MAVRCRAGVLNAYPRVGDTAEDQLLRRTLARRDAGEATDVEVARAEESVAEAAVQEQEEAGLDWVTDGQVGWYDPVSHIARGLEGFAIGGLLRWFDTNTYIRQPERTGPVRHRAPITVAAFEHARRIARKPVKAVLAGPWTLAAHTKLDGIRTEAFSEEILPALVAEVRALAAAGATHIQIDEPSLTLEATLPREVRDASEAFAAAKGKAELGLAVYFGGVPTLLPALLELPYDFLSLDLVQGAATLPALRRSRPRAPLHLGLVDARNTRLEDPSTVAGTVREIAKATNSSEIGITTSNSLEFLPRNRARDKLRILAMAAASVGGGA